MRPESNKTKLTLDKKAKYTQQQQEHQLKLPFWAIETEILTRKLFNRAAGKVIGLRTR